MSLASCRRALFLFDTRFYEKAYVEELPIVACLR